ncbi:hypothetical protein AB0P15_13915 [Streptomyces sp. NPDC087917]|uniref:hypothetical protein n=1 Tax=unclassified Streptomyces TaxID=2593676 RepID=UPI0034374AF5
MRHRTTAAALLASLALVLPTAGLSSASDHDRDHDSLGELHYRYTDGDGESRHGTIEPGDNDTCYQLTGTRRHPAYAVENETDSLALLFEGGSCGGQPEEVLNPGERARNLNVRSVYFKPSDGHHGHHDGRGDEDGRHDGRGDDEGRHDRGDDDRRAAPRTAQGPARGLFDGIFHPAG